MRTTGLFPLWAVVICAAPVLTSCGSSTSTGSSSNPPSPPQTTHVAVADTGDNRVLVYEEPLSATSSATTVIGQISLTEGKANQGAATASSATLDSPQGIAVDSAGDLWVADRGNCRVVEFKAPLTTGMNASLVIGQSDFASTGMNGGWGCPFATSIAPDNMETPVSVALDSHGDLWVADAAASRITEFLPPFSNGMRASLVIGQPNMQSNAPCNGASEGEHGPALPPTAATLCAPQAIAFDSEGNLWVTDAQNSRVLEFVPPFSTGMAASVVLGEPTATVFTGNASCGPSASEFCAPAGLTFDSHGSLWVADLEINRVTEFVPPFMTGMAATLEIGQPNFTSQGPTPTAAMEYPDGLAFDRSGNLLVVSQFSEILVYAPAFSIAMNPSTTVSSGLGSCPPPTPTAGTLCEPVAVTTF